jgi:hypothetical protein
MLRAVGVVYKEGYVSCCVGLVCGLNGMLTSEGAAKSPLVLGREVMTDASSAANFELAKSWLETCMGSHSTCGKAEDMPLPTRLLDVGGQDGREPFLKITDDQRGKYVALSYCWGLSEPFVTTMDSLKQNLEEIPMAKLPKTLQDAVIITRKLGIQYLWIDALCIIQARYKGDRQALRDWQREGSRMATVYGNAWLTIGAGSAADKEDGCFTPRPLDYPRCEVALGEGNPSESSTNGSKLHIYARLPPSQSEGPLHLRAWTFQEAVLSPRMLVYSEAQIVYRCKTISVWENSRSSRVTGSSLQVAHPPSFFARWIFSESRQSESDHILDNWYRALELDFSSRLITRDSDKLPAMSGLAHRIEWIIGGEYCAGLWKSDMIRGLLWKCQNVIPIGKGRYLTQPAEYRAPSWSWAALNGPIFYGHSGQAYLRWIKERNQYPAKIVSVRLDLMQPQCDPMGEVSGGSLDITAPLKTAKLVRKHGLEYKRKVQRYSPPAFQFLMEAKDGIAGGPEDVVGVCSFDLEDGWPNRLWCLLLSVDEGIILVPENERLLIFKRVGFFLLERKDWYLGCEPTSVTIV